MGKKQAPRYQILRDGKLVVVAARSYDRGYGLDTPDQVLADEVMAEIDRACEYFYAPVGTVYEGDSRFAEISDDEVIRRVEAFDNGENQKEAKSRKYPVSSLPIEWKRVLVQNVEAIKARWQFAWVD